MAPDKSKRNAPVANDSQQTKIHPFFVKQAPNPVADPAAVPDGDNLDQPLHTTPAATTTASSSTIIIDDTTGPRRSTRRKSNVDPPKSTTDAEQIPVIDLVDPSVMEQSLELSKSLSPDSKLLATGDFFLNAEQKKEKKRAEARVQMRREMVDRNETMASLSAGRQLNPFFLPKKPSPVPTDNGTSNGSLSPVTLLEVPWPSQGNSHVTSLTSPPSAPISITRFKPLKQKSSEPANTQWSLGNLARPTIVNNDAAPMQPNVKMTKGEVTSYLASLYPDEILHTGAYVSCMKHVLKSPCNQPTDTLLTEKYKPTAINDILGNQAAAHALSEWLSNWEPIDLGKKRSSTHSPQRKKKKIRTRWDDDDLDDFVVSDSDGGSDAEKVQLFASGKSPAILLVGPPGSGKTAIAYAVSQGLGYDILEVHAGMKRGKKELLQIVEATQSHHVSKDGSNDVWASLFKQNGSVDKQDAPTKSKKASRKSSLPKITRKSGNTSSNSRTSPSKTSKGRRKKTKSFDEDEKKSDYEAKDTDDDDFQETSASPPRKSRKKSKRRISDEDDSESPPQIEPEVIEINPDTIPHTRILNEDTEMAVAIQLSLAHQMGVEHNESEIIAEVLKSQANATTPNNNNSNNSNRRSLILIEDADVVFDQDKSFWQAVSTLIETTKRPIILTCNINPLDYANECARPLTNLTQYIAPLWVVRPSTMELASYLHLVTLAEGIWVDSKSLVDLVTECDNDIRKCLSQVPWKWSSLPLFQLEPDADIVDLTTESVSMSSTSAIKVKNNNKIPSTETLELLSFVDAYIDGGRVRHFEIYEPDTYEYPDSEFAPSFPIITKQAMDVGIRESLKYMCGREEDIHLDLMHALAGGMDDAPACLSINFKVEFECLYELVSSSTLYGAPRALATDYAPMVSLICRYDVDPEEGVLPDEPEEGSRRSSRQAGKRKRRYAPNGHFLFSASYIECEEYSLFVNVLNEV
ncbi:hypothetical protein SmJEL517_g04777 [Synchytrium microbalum]|uniref:AAA+ ATPase domain-containing protein n=1 Tax=Synchytrium microbalum TaxID=1806994 RepID=A0A507BY36_9FUNG|nr:uncharacterized protein SmJEL517_g04777 [Synchytrium microbalum]TPX32038.1 hypothetical protein SmJEL517_g04777 [Synchytrium microbalum]